LKYEDIAIQVDEIHVCDDMHIFQSEANKENAKEKLVHN